MKWNYAINIDKKRARQSFSLEMFVDDYLFKHGR